MKHRVIAFTAAIPIAALAALSGPGGPPPAPPELPPGHPAIAPAAATPADPADVASIEAIVGAYYASLSGPAGAPRQWDRFRSLFAPDARLVASRPGGPVTLTPQHFVELNREYFEKSGYFETQIHGHADAFGGIAQVFSTFESRRRPDDAQPYARGITSIQVLQASGRWWITSVVWEHERPEDQPIPPRYLPGGSGPE